MSEIRGYLHAIGKLGQKSEINTFLLKYGKNFNSNDKSYLGKRGKQHECFRNAGQIALMNNNMIYVEGYVAVHGVPLHHAWLLDRSSKDLIDPTLKDGKGITEYYGVPLKSDWLRKFIFKTKYWGVLGYMTYNTFIESKPETGVENI